MSARVDHVSDKNQKSSEFRDTSPFQVGEWLIDPSLGRACHADRVAKIDPRNIRVLQILAERQGSVVSLQELQTLAWDGTVVTFDSLYQSIRQLRQALGDTKAPPKYIQTVPRKGYRLIAPVNTAAAADPLGEPVRPTVHAAETPAAVELSTVPGPATRRRGLHIAAFLTLVLAVIAIVRMPADLPAATDDVMAARPGRALSVQTLRDLGTIHLRQGRPKEAREHYALALQKQLTKTGEDNEIVARILVELTRASLWLDDTQAAYATATRAVDIFDRLTSAPNPDRILTYSIVAESFIAAGDYERAEPLVQSALSLAEDLYGPDHAATSEPRGLRALLYLARGEVVQAERAARKTLETSARVRGTDDTTTAHWHTTLASILLDQGRFDEAEAEAREGVRILERVADTTHPYLWSAMHVLADVLVAQGRDLREAEALASTLLEALQKSGAARWRIARAEGVLGEAELHQGRIAEADAHLSTAKEGLTPAHGWPLDREARRLEARIQRLSERRRQTTNLASL